MADEKKQKRDVPAVDGKIIQIVPDPYTGDILALTDAGKVYRRTKITDDIESKEGQSKKAMGRNVWIEIPEVEEFGVGLDVASTVPPVVG